MSQALYDQGKYNEALQSFEANLKNATDFYNAGNCHYKLGHYGQALAYYEKAFSLAPNNDDVRHNRNLAEKNLLKTGSIPVDQSFWTGKFVPLTRSAPESLPWFMLALSMFALAFALKKAQRRTRKLLTALKTPVVLGVFILSLLFGSMGGLMIAAHQTPMAVVLAESTSVRSGPSQSFTELFKLPAGVRVEIASTSREGWFQIRFSLGNVGWVLEKDLLRL